METDATLAERLFKLSDGSDEQLYRTELEGEVDLYDLVLRTEFKEVNYAPEMTAWSVLAPSWTQYAFAVVLDGHSLICAGPSDVQTAKQAIDDCLKTLIAAGDFDKDVRRSGEISEIDLDSNPPNWVEVDSQDDEFSITPDHDLRRQKQIQLALTNPPSDFNQVRLPNVNRCIPIAHRGDEIIIDGKRCSCDRSPNEQYTIAYTHDELFLLTTEVLIARISISGLRTASISNSGAALIAGNPSESDQSEQPGSTDINVDFKIGKPNYSDFDDKIAFYSLEGELFYREPVSGRVLDGAITADGTYATVLTETEEATITHVYDVSDRTKLWEHETRDKHPSQLGEKRRRLHSNIMRGRTESFYRKLQLMTRRTLSISPEKSFGPPIRPSSGMTFLV